MKVDTEEKPDMLQSFIHIIFLFVVCLRRHQDFCRGSEVWSADAL